MQISTKSWHYRLLTLYGIDHAYTLCPYFWQVMGALFIMSPIVLVLSPFFLVCAVGAWLGGGLRRTVETVRPGQNRPARPPSLLRLRYRAWKMRVCPDLDFVYPEPPPLPPVRIDWPDPFDPSA